MITEALFERVIQNPLVAGANRLVVLSGAGSAAMALRVLLYAAERRRSLTLELVIGLAGELGVAESNHQDLLSLHESPPAPDGRLEVCYVLPPNAVNSNVFVWCEDENPLWAWSGSSRFLQRDFAVGAERGTRLNALADVNPVRALDYIRQIQSHTIRSEDKAVAHAIKIIDDSAAGSSEPGAAGTATVALPLVTLQRGLSRGNIHASSGLNWGQRPGRDPNQAYIPIPKEVRSTAFFPSHGTVFRVRTEDGLRFLARTAQEGNKALETPQSNSILGEYFRGRLGVPLGQGVQLSDLLTFGSRFVLIHRLSSADDNELDYLLEYSRRADAIGAETYNL